MIFYIIYTKMVGNMEVKILGNTASIPDVGNDCPCFLVDEEFLIDCGLDVLSDLRETNCDLSKIRYIIFTHMHYNPAAAAEILKDAKFSWLIFNHVFDNWHIECLTAGKRITAKKICLITLSLCRILSAFRMTATSFYYNFLNLRRC